ncbi:thiamine phosphate synthase [Jeotgalibacillus proteolyticus]|uniref:Thiamine phosphate synthase n=1 Tax=Jeotgalibacillus proteolyticus TaxID=2082395 RepID=A0A2S5GDI9_9BACL|nr:thiamine phosphate synthase [Jeotgalibacillus proteolyticus]PPA70974.1 thiamine phosphate synthase [Jeotgalibacillus proteolyticus]
MNNGFSYHVLSTCGQISQKWMSEEGFVHNSVDSFHIRDKNATAAQLLAYVDELLKKGLPASKLVINDRVDVALSRDLSVQLAYHSLPLKEVKAIHPTIKAGVSVHSAEEAEQAAKDGADYVIFGHIFETESKPGVEPRGLETLRSVVQACSVPVIAIGGIKPSHIPLIQQTGAAGAALLSGVMQAEEPLKAIEDYRREELECTSRMSSSLAQE